MNRIFNSIVISLLLFTSVFAAAPSPGSDVERLNFLVPKGWAVAYQSQSKTSAITEFIPKREKLDNWTRMLTIQTYRHPEKYQPDKFITLMSNLAKHTCEKVNLNPVRNGKQNGYSFSHKILMCIYNQVENKYELINIKAIKGHVSFYVLQVAARTDMSEEEMKSWGTYFRDVVVSPATK